MSEEYYDVARTTFRGQFAWDPQACAAHAVDATARMVSSCGFDVKTATAEELDGADVRVKRATRSSGEKWVACMPWRTAALEWHRVILHSSYYDQPSYGRASPAQVSAAKPLEPAARNLESSSREVPRKSWRRRASGTSLGGRTAHDFHVESSPPRLGRAEGTT
ncbi:hypothetical protein BC629DRAFT_808292 [Irpex lacteus]|nr:hypothetical protein BC629DRAFT_808292 [Irpex lacteus]